MQNSQSENEKHILNLKKSYNRNIFSVHIIYIKLDIKTRKRWNSSCNVKLYRRKNKKNIFRVYLFTLKIKQENNKKRCTA